METDKEKIEQTIKILEFHKFADAAPDYNKRVVIKIKNPRFDPITKFSVDGFFGVRKKMMINMEDGERDYVAEICDVAEGNRKMWELNTLKHFEASWAYFE